MRIGWRSRTTDPAVASFRYRVLKPIEILRSRGHAVELWADGRASRYDKVVFSKVYGPDEQALARRLRDAGKEVILDLCDNHFYNPFALASYVRARENLAAMIGLSSSIICSTPALARVVMQEAGVERVPHIVGDMFEDLGTFAEPAHGPPRLLWFGLHGSPNAPAGMADILLVADELASLAARIPFELVVASNNRAKFDEIVAPLPLQTRYVEWTPKSFAAELSAASAVILPLSDNPFVACKTHNRLSVALAAGIPVVGDVIESYREFAPYCYLGNWRAGLAAVLSDPMAARAKAAGGRAYLEAYWSADAIARQWETVLGLSNGGARRAPKNAKSTEKLGRPVGNLRLSPAEHFLGWVHVPHRNGLPVQVALTINGEPRAVTPADLPAVRPRKGEYRLTRDGGFVFPRDVLGSSKEPLLRCTISLAGTGEPVVNAMVDVHRP